MIFLSILVHCSIRYINYRSLHREVISAQLYSPFQPNVPYKIILQKKSSQRIFTFIYSINLNAFMMQMTDLCIPSCFTGSTKRNVTGNQITNVLITSDPIVLKTDTNVFDPFRQNKINTVFYLHT